MQCRIHPTTSEDLVAGIEGWSQEGDAEWEGRIDALLQACVVSTQIWTAADASDQPIAFMGAAPLAHAPDTGRVWFVVFGPPDGEESTLVEAVKLATAEMLVEFRRLENLVDAEEGWAIELLRQAGFTIEPAMHLSRKDRPYHRVWLEGRLPPGRLLH